ncbi:hypothetical protein AB0F20_09965 [Streptomyces goshikiensis]|uniref:hypothetical protein n=1 Tax=Streptomyces goshikiensis TaxID=1942 RepID=UPI0033F70240
MIYGSHRAKGAPCWAPSPGRTDPSAAAPARDHALTLAREMLRPGDIVLVKGSHSVGLEHTAERLAQPHTMADDR